MKQLNVFRANHKTIANCVNFINTEDGNMMHKLFTAAVCSNRKNADLLYRIIRTREEILLYVSSNVDCNVKYIEDFGFEHVKKIDIEELISLKHAGDTVSFNVKLLPYRRSSDKFYYINSFEDRLLWVKEKLSQCGICVQTIRENAMKDLYFSRGNIRNRMTSGDYIGIAKITDKDALLKAISNGVGREKCFGAGLLLVM